MANVYDLLKQGTAGDSGLNNTDLLPAEENNEVSTIASIFAGVGSGLIDIPKGLFSLGASIYDLTNDTNKAAKIEAIVLTSLFSSAGKRSVLFRPGSPAVPCLSKS